MEAARLQRRPCVCFSLLPPPPPPPLQTRGMWEHAPRIPGPQTPDLRPQTPDLRPRTSDLRPQTSDLGPSSARRRAVHHPLRRSSDFVAERIGNGVQLIPSCSKCTSSAPIRLRGHGMPPRCREVCARGGLAAGSGGLPRVAERIPNARTFAPACAVFAICHVAKRQPLHHSLAFQ